MVYENSGGTPIVISSDIFLPSQSKTAVNGIYESSGLN